MDDEVAWHAARIPAHTVWPTVIMLKIALESPAAWWRMCLVVPEMGRHSLRVGVGLRVANYFSETNDSGQYRACLFPDVVNRAVGPGKYHGIRVVVNPGRCNNTLASYPVNRTRDSSDPPCFWAYYYIADRGKYVYPEPLAIVNKCYCASRVAHLFLPKPRSVESSDRFIVGNQTWFPVVGYDVIRCDLCGQKRGSISNMWFCASCKRAWCGARRVVYEEPPDPYRLMQTKWELYQKRMGIHCSF